jgi:ketosteroid isomerase-like protein
MNSDLEDNKQLAHRFVDAFERRDIAAIADLLSEDFVWHVAVVGDDESEPRPFQSAELRSKPWMLPPVKQSRQETLGFFQSMFDVGADPRYHFHLRLISVMAEGDRVAFEAESDMLSPVTGRRYRNLYFILLRVRDGKIALYKEYQDTLHIYDVHIAK